MKITSKLPLALSFLLISNVALAVDAIEQASTKKKQAIAPSKAYQAMIEKVREREVNYSTATLLLFQAEHRKHKNTLLGLREHSHSFRKNQQN
tara:strand:+ start:386 stop:664 length:279 start_codon:yes stop_codon:yes gene_type:complete